MRGRDGRSLAQVRAFQRGQRRDRRRALPHARHPRESRAFRLLPRPDGRGRDGRPRTGRGPARKRGGGNAALRRQIAGRSAILDRA